MRYSVELTAAVDFHPATETEEILQNVRTILATRVGSVPLDRGFGLTWEHVDKPYPVARSLMTAAVIEAIEAMNRGLRWKVSNLTATRKTPWTAYCGRG